MPAENPVAGQKIIIDALTVVRGKVGAQVFDHAGNWHKDYWINGTRIMVGTSEPITGSFLIGDRVLNSLPAVGQPKGWICTVSGTPGTWLSEGNL